MTLKVHLAAKCNTGCYKIRRMLELRCSLLGDDSKAVPSGLGQTLLGYRVSRSAERGYSAP